MMDDASSTDPAATNFRERPRFLLTAALIPSPMTYPIPKMAIQNPARLLGVTPRNSQVKFMKEVSGVAQNA